MKFAPKDGQTAGFCTTAVCISCPRREGDAPIAIPFGSQPNAFPCGRVFKTTGTTYTTRTTILISHGLSRMSTDDTENDYMIESTLKSGLNLLFYGSALARARPARGRRTPAQGRMSIANGTLGKTRPDGTRPTGQVETFAMTLRSGLPTITPSKTDSNRAVSLCILQGILSVSPLWKAVLHVK